MSREDREKYGELRVLEYSFNLEGDGRRFEVIGINDADAAIIEHSRTIHQ